MMMKKTYFMFSGQGSQYYHMGKELYENHSKFKFWMDHCDEIAHSFIQCSLVDILYRGHGKTEPFDQILYTNSALLCVEYSLAQVLIDMKIRPDFLLGYSLGEITASVLSGILSLEDGMQVVVGMAKQIKAKTRSAKMLAIIAGQKIMADFPDLFLKCRLVGNNYDNNFVVSGSADDIQHLQEGLSRINIVSQILPVKYGFHTEQIDPIEKDFKALVRQIKCRPMGIPVVSSLSAGMVPKAGPDYFWELIRYPVDFEKTVKWAMRKGECIFIDAGPSGSLATFVKYILQPDSGSIALQMINQFGRDLNSIEKLRAAFCDLTSH